MFKNKSRLAKKLAMFAAACAVPVSILAANSNTSAMYRSSALGTARRLTSASATRRPFVQPKEINRSKICDLSDEQLIQEAKNISGRGDKLKVSIYDACDCGRFEFARYLLDNKLASANDNLHNRLKNTCLDGAIRYGARIQRCEEVDKWVQFVKDLVEKYGAKLNGMHACGNPLICSFCDWADFSDKDEELIEKKMEALEEVFSFLISKGMLVNSIIFDNCTFRKLIEDMNSISTRKNDDVYFPMLHRMVIEYGGKRYV